MDPVIKVSSPETGGFWEIPVLYEDDSLLALDKPSKLFTSPDGDNPTLPNLMKLLHDGIAQGKPWAQKRALEYLMNAHRLDFEVSGVILLVKNKAALIKVANVFGAEQESRKYVALSRGAPITDEFLVDAKLGPNPARPSHTRVDREHGKAARTKFQVLERFSGWTFLQCEPLTNRSDQIQAHLQHVALPLVGASSYGGRPLLLSSLKPNYRLKPGHTERPLISRAALHAQQLILPHPETNETLTLTAPLPKDLTVALKYLRIFAKT